MKIALGVTGCIAAYKAVEVMRGLQKAGVTVQVVMTRSARRFLSPLTFEALSGEPVLTGMFRSGANEEIGHIRIAQEIALLAVVPATANMIGKFAHGIADDFLSTLYLACPAPVLLAPAMNVEMWGHPAVRANIAVLRERGHLFVDPEPGVLACGMEGEGKLADVDRIVTRILGTLRQGESLAGLKVLVTAGPTIEDLDPVRFISNRSSGKMGYAVARAARQRGAEVVLISGPVRLEPPYGVRLVPVRSAREMKDAVLEAFPHVDVVIKAAAVADYRPAAYAAEKLKKTGLPSQLELVPTDDILAELGAVRKDQVLVGFSAETGDPRPHATSKMEQKNLDMIVANDVAGVFGADTASVYIMLREGETVTMAGAPKLEIAHRILDLVLGLRNRRTAGRAS